MMMMDFISFQLTFPAFHYLPHMTLYHMGA